MFGSQILEVAIGLAFVYLLFSLLCSALTEALSRGLELRAKTLRAGLVKMLGDGRKLRPVEGKPGNDAKTTPDNLLAHPLIAGLASKKHGFGKLVWGGKPAYIPAHAFALALLDVVTQGTGSGDESNLPEKLDAPKTTGDLWAKIRESGDIDTTTARALHSLLVALGDAAPIEEAIEAIETWFDHTMERVTGWYTRQARLILFALAFAVSLAYNVDSIMLANEFATNATLRDTVIEAAAELVEQQAATMEADAAAAEPDEAEGTAGPKGDAETEDANEADAEEAAGAPAMTVDEIETALDALDLPIGWSSEEGAPNEQLDLADWSRENVGRMANKLAGLLVTTFAVMLGATFWFDTLKSLISLRANGKVPAPPATD
jgi:hypothetical protein